MLGAAVWALAPATRTPVAGETTSDSAATPGAAAATGDPIGDIELTGSEFAFAPATIDVPGAGTYRLVLHNEGTVEHDVSTVDGSVTLLAQPGETVEGLVTVPAAGLELICSIPGHADAGMKVSVSVAGGGWDHCSRSRRPGLCGCSRADPSGIRPSRMRTRSTSARSERPPMPGSTDCLLASWTSPSWGFAERAVVAALRAPHR